MPRVAEVREVWHCRYCGWDYRSVIELSAATCRKGHQMTKTWSRKEARRVAATV